MELDPAVATTTKDAKKGKEQASEKSDPKSKKKTSTVPSNEIASEQARSSETIEEIQRPALQLQQLNTVIFGLPNLTFTP